LVRVSASQINDWLLCRRKWFYRVVLRVPKVDHPSAILGTAIHARLESYFNGTAPGTDKEWKLAKMALPYLPNPAPRLEIEKRFILPRLVNGVFWAYYGLIDLVDPAAHMVYDHKSSSNPKQYGLSPAKLPWDTQGVLYGAAAVNEWGWQVVGLQWTYIPTKGRGRSFPIEARLTREQAFDRLKVLDGHALAILEARKETDVEKITPNGAACSAFGGCSYAAICSHPKRDPLTALLAEGRRQHEGQVQMTIDPAMLAKIKAAASGNAPAPVAAAPVAAAPVAAAPVATPTPTESMADVIARVKAQAAQSATPTPAAQAPAMSEPCPPTNDPVAAAQAALAKAQAEADAAAKIQFEAAAAEELAEANAAAASAAAANAALSQEPGEGLFDLYINCVPLAQSYYFADRLIDSAAGTAALANNVTHYREIPHGKYMAALSHALESLLKGTKWDRPIVVMRGREEQDAMHTLRAYARNIIIGV
jgi:cell pole-organizing protein PopZ/CRISPR/Cas system-associated exonuclease Cas4 (RecB family)